MLGLEEPSSQFLMRVARGGWEDLGAEERSSSQARGRSLRSVGGRGRGLASFTWTGPRTGEREGSSAREEERRDEEGGEEGKRVQEGVEEDEGDDDGDEEKKERSSGGAVDVGGGLGREAASGLGLEGCIAEEEMPACQSSWHHCVARRM